eukprot:gene6157-1100_t
MPPDVDHEPGFGAIAPTARERSLRDFELLDTLGTGTFGRVRLCRLRETGAHYAIKILKKSEVIRMKQVDHIVAERDLLFGVRHPFKVDAVAAFQDRRKLYVVLEYVSGGEVFSHLRRVGKFPNRVARFYTAQIVLLFEHLHRNGVMYRDLKPENLLLGEGYGCPCSYAAATSFTYYFAADGHVKLTDFGFAKRVSRSPQQSGAPPGPVLPTYTLCGTPEYLAPEIILSKGHTVGVDWWSLGVLVFEMLVGCHQSSALPAPVKQWCPPFYAESPFAIYHKILHDPLVIPEWLDPDAADFIRQLLAKDPDMRLGIYGRGVIDLKSHAWFTGLLWEDLLLKKTPPPIPIVMAEAGDCRHFDKYPDSDPESSPPHLDVPEDIFSSF